MKLFADLDTQGHIANADEFNATVKRFYALSRRELAIKNLQKVEARLQAWTEVMHEAGFTNFDAKKLLFASHEIGENIFLQASLVSNSSIKSIDSNRIYVDTNATHEDIGSNFGFLSVKRGRNGDWIDMKKKI